VAQEQFLFGERLTSQEEVPMVATEAVGGMCGWWLMRVKLP